MPIRRRRIEPNKALLLTPKKGQIRASRLFPGWRCSIYKAIGVKRAQPTLTRWLKRTEERIVGL